MSDQVRFIDTTIRDGQGSLWATSMRARHMMAVMPYLDSAGFDSMEFLAPGSRLKKFVRHLRENPWLWIREGAGAAKRTPLRWHGSIFGEVLSGRVPPEVGELLVEKAVELGIRYVRPGNGWNDFTWIADEVERYSRLGMTSIVNIVYSVSPKHTDEYFVEKAREAGSLRPYRLCLKDVGGLLTPERIRELLPKMMQAAGDVVWEFHGHSNNGLSGRNAVECVKQGIRYIHTAIPPLANGDSQPSLYTLASNLRFLGYKPIVGEDILRPATEILTQIARREGFPIGVPREWDEKLYHHQIPGAMISNLRYQLRLAGLEDRLEEVLEETGWVRADFGYPIMVTPLSQIVGSQAAINVITGKRYEQVTDMAIEYALGRHGGGDEAVNGMDEEVRAKILDRPRAREIELAVSDPPSLSDLRARYGPIPDEDLILLAIVGDDAIDLVGSVSDNHTFAQARRPLFQLVQQLMEQDTPRVVSVQKGSLAFTLEKAHIEPKGTT